MPIRASSRQQVNVRTPFLAFTPPLSVEVLKQERSRWCWAACAQMVTRFYGHPAIPQCEIAKTLFRMRRLFANVNCCATGGIGPCNHDCSLGDIAPLYEELHIRSTFTPGPVSFEMLQEEVAERRPVQVCFEFGPMSRHVLLVVGTRSQDGQPAVVLNDPDPARIVGGMTYEELKIAGTAGTWCATWTGIERALV